MKNDRPMPIMVTFLAGLSGTFCAYASTHQGPAAIGGAWTGLVGWLFATALWMLATIGLIDYAKRP